MRASRQDQEVERLMYAWPVRGSPSVEAVEELARELSESLGEPVDALVVA
jgi:hypothetical protein